MDNTFTVKRDKYKSARGGHSRLLDICCRSCEQIVAVYQKDGPGMLRRMYLDRIRAPQALTGLHTMDIGDVPALACQQCGNILGSPYVYVKEKRSAFRMHQDAFIKRLRK